LPASLGGLLSNLFPALGAEFLGSGWPAFFPADSAQGDGMGILPGVRVGLALRRHFGDTGGKKI